MSKRKMRKMTLKEMQEMRDAATSELGKEKWQKYIDNHFFGGDVPVVEE